MSAANPSAPVRVAEPEIVPALAKPKWQKYGVPAHVVLISEIILHWVREMTMADTKPAITTTDANSAISSRRERVVSIKMLSTLCLVLLAPGLMCAQASAQKADTPQNDSDVAAELKILREVLSQTQKQVALQQQEIDALKAQSRAEQSVSLKNEQPPRLVEVSTPSAVSFSPGSADSNIPGTAVVQPVAQEEAQKGESPLSFKIGPVVLTPGGFVDLENIFRTTNTQNNIATNFTAIPFSNTAQGHLTEFRTTAQYSRFNITVKDKFGANDITGYCEADFSGNDATNAFQTVNGHTFRLRLCFMDLKRGKWEILGGQTWSWLTPNRTGFGPMPSDLALTYNEDQNIGVGLSYTRAAELRVAYHLNDHWAFGVGIEDPDQFIGGFVALPQAYSATLGLQFDNGAQLGTPNLFPDILPKIAYDTEVGGRHLHLEAVGLVTGARASVVPIGGKSFSSHSAVGGGGSIAGNFELFRNFYVLANAFWSDGGGRYLVADGPQLVLRPNAAGTDIAPSMVHAGAGSAGLEWIASHKTTLAAYYGQDYFGRNFFVDTTNTTTPGTIIGYGGPGSPNTNNRAIQEATFDWIQVFWKSPRYGTLQYYTQYSYLSRAPWFVGTDAPKNAHLSMVYAGIRFVLPSTFNVEATK
jgi:hypothetical protein